MGFILCDMRTRRSVGGFQNEMTARFFAQCAFGILNRLSLSRTWANELWLSHEGEVIYSIRDEAPRG